MNLLQRLLHRPPRRLRVLDEARFALGGALVGAAAGFTVAALVTTAPLRPLGEKQVVHWLMAVAPGAGYGWWGGLLWSVLLAFSGRALKPQPPVDAMLGPTFTAAVVLVAAVLACRLGGLPPLWGLAAGFVAGTLAARHHLARIARRATS